MSIFIQRRYINALGSRLERFTNKGNDTWAFRCPLCGDSKKNKTKMRGHIYRSKNEFYYKCFNCSVSTTFGKLMKEVAPDMVREYKLDLFKDKKGEPNKEEQLTEMIDKMKENNERLKRLTLSEVWTPIMTLPEDHVAKKYVIGRKIPYESWKYLNYTKDFRNLVLTLNPERAEKLPTGEHRLVIATYNQDDVLIGVAGRALEKDAFQRYVHVKASSDYPKIFGLDRIKTLKEPAFVFEGPIDAMFFENGMATCDSDLSFATRFHSDCILVPDNEPRNPDIVKNVKKFIDTGFRVCLFPDHNKFKDVNDMILGGMLLEDIKKEILENTFEGTRASLVFSRWKKN